jgi:hypothetical protein
LIRNVGEKQSKKERRAARAEAGKPSDAELEKLLADLTPEQAEMFVDALELAVKKRRLMLWGYVAAAFALLAGIAAAFWIYGTREEGQFVGWAFLIPPGLAGLMLFVFGRWSRALKPSNPPPPAT